MNVRVRFAPSPTGFLHLGNARTALINALFARQRGGVFVLRIDDTDRARSEELYVEAIREDLRWLGLDWQEEHRQTQREPAHLAAFERLREAGRIYACTETPEALEAWRAGRKPAVYKRGSLPPGSAAAYWRFDLGRGRVSFDDLVQGPQAVDLASQSDPVVRRGDGSFAFLFASIVDDVDLAISHVVRGADHITNTGTQIAIAEALGATPPVFAHLPLILDADGHGLSKRRGSASLRELREQGIEPLAVAQLLATLGTGRAAEAGDGLDALAAALDLTAFGKGSPRLDSAELARRSAEVVRQLPFVAVRSRLPEGADEPFWLAVRSSLDRVEDAMEWWRVCREPLSPVVEDAAFTQKAAELLPNPADWERWIDSLKAATGRKGKALFHPLRLALTARERGPELKHLLTLLPRETVSRRLRGETA
jgi:glutamyl-tRNA synthetase